MEFSELNTFYLRKFLKQNFKAQAPVEAVSSSLTFGTGDSEIVFTAVDKGVGGDNISVSILDSEEDSDLSFSFDIISKALVIYPEKTSDAVSSTCEDIADALNANLTIQNYVSVSGGTGLIDLQAKTNLSGGVNGSVAIGGFSKYVDGNDVYFCFEDSDFSSTEKWRKASGESTGDLDYDSILNYNEVLDYDEIL